MRFVRQGVLHSPHCLFKSDWECANVWLDMQELRTKDGGKNQPLEKILGLGGFNFNRLPDRGDVVQNWSRDYLGFSRARRARHRNNAGGLAGFRSAGFTKEGISAQEFSGLAVDWRCSAG